MSFLNGSLKGMDPKGPTPFKEPQIPSLQSGFTYLGFINKGKESFCVQCIAAQNVDSIKVLFLCYVYKS